MISFAMKLATSTPLASPQFSMATSKYFNDVGKARIVVAADADTPSVFVKRSNAAAGSSGMRLEIASTSAVVSTSGGKSGSGVNL